MSAHTALGPMSRAGLRLLARVQDPAVLRATVNVSLVVLLLTLPIPALLGKGTSYFGIVAAIALVMAAIVLSEEPKHRRILAQLSAIAFAWRWVLLLGFGALEESAATVVLGPDGYGYFQAAAEIVDQGFVLPRPSYEYFATFDTAHMYVFAMVVRLFGASLFVLHVFNTAISTLIAPLTYAWVMRVAPACALPSALLVTAFTSITYFAAVDLLKDPSVITALTLAIWALGRLCSGQLSMARLAALGLTATASLAYIHTSRSYPLFYLEAGVLVTGVALALRRRLPPPRATVAVLTVLLAAEGLPMAAGWPPTPVFFMASVNQFQSVDAVRYFSAGLLERLKSPSGAERPRPTYRLREFEGMPGTSARTTLQVEVEENQARTTSFGSVGWIVQIVRRMLGPFVWIAPPAFEARAVLAGDYLLYPGMLFWYALLPWMALGTAIVAWGVVRGHTPFMVGVVGVYCTLYLAQYLVVNLSYRQRDALFPLLAVLACIGIERAGLARWARWSYLVYWIALVSVAVAHLVVRSRL